MIRESSSSSDVVNVEPLPKGVIRKRVTAKDIEKWEVAQLNCNLEPRSKPSDLFDKLAEKRKTQHEAVLLRLGQNLHEINLRTEKNIKISSLEVKAHIKEFDDELKNILTSIDIPEVASYDVTVFLEFQNKANEYKAKQQQLVNELYDDLNKFENERAEENEKLFHSACEEIRKIGYFLPYDVQSFVENETLKMNQLSLNNRRCYDDLKLTLTLLTEQTYKSFMDKVFCIQAKWVQNKMNVAYTNFKNTSEERIAKIAPTYPYNRLEMRGQELLVQFSPDDVYSTCKAEEWAKNVEGIVSTIETYGLNLIELYKKTLNAVYHSFDHEVEEIRRELKCVETLDIEERIIKPIMFEAQNDQAKEIQALEFYWQDTLRDIKSLMIDVTEFLMDAGKLWDAHTERVCESKKLILTALEKADENNQESLEELEVKLNIALDTLRQEHNKGKLAKSYDAVVTILESIKSKYEHIYLVEVSTVEDFYKMMNLEADVLSAELREFIYTTHTLDHNKNIYQFADQFRSMPSGRPLFKDMQTCIQQIKAVKSWREGVWTAMEIFSLNTREFLKPRAESWVQNKIEMLAEKMSIQIELTKKRFDRIQIEIYEKRLQEIESHEEIFQQHKESVKLTYSKLKEEMKKFTSAELNKLDKVKESFSEIEANVKQENRPGVIYSNLTLTQKKKQDLEYKLKVSYERFRADGESKSFELSQTNFNFMKSIKLFHEDGNFSGEEGKMYATLLESVDKDITLQSKNFVKDSMKEENDMAKKLSLITEPTIALLTALHEETTFYYEIQLRIKNFATEIRNTTENFKSDFEILNSQAACLYNTITSREKPLKGKGYKFWKYVLQLLYKNFSNLFYHLSFPDDSDESNAPEEESWVGEEETVCCCTGKFSLKGTISKTPTFRTTEAEESFSCKDFKKDLFHFEEPPEMDGSFMSVISNSLWSELDAIQRLTCTFYKRLPGKKIIREDLIPPTYDAFIEEIVKRFQCYNNQCEELWCQMVLDFLPLLGNIKVAGNNYLERVLDEYEYKVVTSLRNFEEDFLKCLEFQKSICSEVFEALDKKLLPLHGYPQNSGLLDALEEEVVQRTAGLGIKWESSINSCKSQLKCFRNYHIKEKSEVIKIHFLVYKIIKLIFIDDFGENLLDLILEYSDRGGFWTRRTSRKLLLSKGKPGADNKTTDEEKMPEEYNLNLELMHEGLNDVMGYLKRLRTLIERERYPDSIPSECPPCPEGSLELLSLQTEVDVCLRYCTPKMNVLLHPVDSEDYVDKLLERLDMCCKRIMSFAQSQTNVHEEALFKWLSLWKLNVKKIRKLYCVKYEEKT